MNKEQLKKLFETRNENKNIDFKESFKFSKSENPKETMCLIKDILAFSNTQDGGNIIIGVKDDDFSIQGVEEEHLSSFDQTKLNQLLEQYTSPNHYCNVRKSKIEDKNIVIISIPEYDEMPIICNKEYTNQDDGTILQKGQLYVRDDKAETTTIKTEKRMRSFLQTSIQKRSDYIIKSIERLIKGQDEEIKKVTFKEEIEEAKSKLKTNSKIDYDIGYLELINYPVRNNSIKIETSEIEEFLINNQIRKSTFYFPQINYYDQSVVNKNNIEKGLMVYNTNDDITEGYIYKHNGLFLYQRNLWEDKREEKDENEEYEVVSVDSTVYIMTQFFEFLKRIYGKIASNENIYIQINLYNIKDKKLKYYGQDYLKTFGDYINEVNEKISLERQIEEANLRIHWKELAKSFSSEIFRYFNWENPSDLLINEIQNKLLNNQW